MNTQIDFNKFYILEPGFGHNGTRCYGMWVVHPNIELYDEKGIGLFQVFAMEKSMATDQTFVPFYLCFFDDQILNENEIDHVKFLAQGNLMYPEKDFNDAHEI